MRPPLFIHPNEGHTWISHQIGNAPDAMNLNMGTAAHVDFISAVNEHFRRGGGSISVEELRKLTPDWYEQSQEFYTKMHGDDPALHKLSYGERMPNEDLLKKIAAIASLTSSISDRPAPHSSSKNYWPEGTNPPATGLLSRFSTDIKQNFADSSKGGVALRAGGILAGLGVSYHFGRKAIRGTKIDPETREPVPMSWQQRTGNAIAALAGAVGVAVSLTLKGRGA